MIAKKFLITLMALSMTACASQTKQLVQFNPNQPVEVHRDLLKPRIFQRGEYFDFVQLKDSLSENEQAEDKISTGKIYYYSGIIFAGVTAGLFVTSENTEDILTTAVSAFISLGLYRYGIKHFLDVGDIHNSQFKRVKSKSSGLGIGLKPVAQAGQVAPLLTFSTSL